MIAFIDGVRGAAPFARYHRWGVVEISVLLAPRSALVLVGDATLFAHLCTF